MGFPVPVDPSTTNAERAVVVAANDSPRQLRDYYFRPSHADTKRSYEARGLPRTESFETRPVKSVVKQKWLFFLRTKTINPRVVVDGEDAAAGYSQAAEMDPTIYGAAALVERLAGLGIERIEDRTPRVLCSVL